jgi:apolipoprotein N-acyltransferase
MAFVGLYRALARRFSVSLPLWAAAAWTGAELLRSRLLTGSSFFSGNPWGLVGYSQVGFDAVVQIASLAGVYGISFVVVAANAALAELWIAHRQRRRLGPRAAAGLGLAVLPALTALLFGFTRLAGALPAPATERSRGAIEVAVVQGNVTLGHRWRSDYYGRNLEIYLGLTRDALSRGRPEIVFWPEAAMTFFVEDEPSYRFAIARFLASAGAELVAGSPRAVGSTSQYFNSIYLISPTGQIAGRYDKQYLVPFAEFFPLGRIDLLKRSFGRVRELSPGEEAAGLPTRAGAAGVVICNEAWFPEVAAERVRGGASYLFNPSNDTYFGDSFALQSFDMVRLRAVEQHRYLVRASTSGPSAVVDPWGRVQGQTGPSANGVLLGHIHPIDQRSVYARTGDLFAIACALAAALGALAVRLGGAKRRASP